MGPRGRVSSTELSSTTDWAWRSIAGRRWRCRGRAIPALLGVGGSPVLESTVTGKDLRVCPFPIPQDLPQRQQIQTSSASRVPPKPRGLSRHCRCRAHPPVVQSAGRHVPDSLNKANRHRKAYTAGWLRPWDGSALARTSPRQAQTERRRPCR